MRGERGTKPADGKALIIGVLAASLLLAAIVASLPVEILVGVVPDDSFYYLVVARNMAATGLSTFDGENPANGYHPGWMLLLRAAAHWFPGKVELLRAALVISFAFHAATGYLLYGCLRRFVPGAMAALAAGVWMFSYLPLVIAAFALETSLYCFCFLLSYWVYLGRVEPYLRTPSGKIPAVNLILFGSALGLCLWARTEGILLLACAIAWLGLATFYGGCSWRKVFLACRSGVLIGVAALAVIAPWILYSLHNFGTVRQTSGAMKMLWRQQENAGLSGGERLWSDVSRYGEWICSSLPWTWGGNFGLVLAMSLVWFAFLAAATVYVVRQPREVRRAAGRVLPAVAYPLLHLFVAGAVYSAFFTDVQGWYLAMPYLEFYLAAVVLGGAIYRAEGCEERRKRWRTQAIAVAAVFTALSLVRFVQTLHQGYWAWQRDVYASLEPVDKLLPGRPPIGCFNAGIPRYFSPMRIINLDGLTNAAVVPYWRTKQVDRYLRDAGIGIIFDDALAIERARLFMRESPRLEELAQFPMTNFVGETRFLWKLHWDPALSYQPRPTGQ